jgi:hypothetical protein
MKNIPGTREKVTTLKIPIISKLAYYSEIGSMFAAFLIAIWYVTWWQALIFAFTASRVFFFLVMLLFTAMRCGIAYLGNWVTMLQINALGKNRGGQFIVTTFVIIYVILFPLVKLFDFPLYFAVPIWLVVLGTLGMVLIPPAVLFLGASNIESYGFERKLKNAVFPLRVVSLLNPNSSKLVDPIHNVRLVDNQDWQSAVGKLSAFATVIVDIRNRSEFVDQEIQILLNGSSHRLIFLLVDEDFSSPILDENSKLRKTVNRLSWTILPSNLMIGAFRYFAHVIGMTHSAKIFCQELKRDLSQDKFNL